MNKLLSIISLSLFATSCATSYSRAWVSPSGSTDNGAAYETLSTKDLKITVMPNSLTKNALTLQVKIQNLSDKSVEIDVSNIKLKTSSGEVLDQLTEQEITNKINGMVAMSGMIAGGSLNSNQYLASKETNETLSKIIRSGKLPAKSEKNGVLYFEGTKSKGDISVVILKPLLDSDKEVQFKFAKK